MHEKSLKVLQPVREEFPTVQTQGSPVATAKAISSVSCSEAARWPMGPAEGRGLQEQGAVWGLCRGEQAGKPAPRAP